VTAAADRQLKVVKFVQELLLDDQDKSAITPAIILENIDKVIGMNPKWGEGLDRDAVVDELIRRFSLWIGQDTTLKNDEGHIAWLNASRKNGWRYWQRYREWLELKFSFNAVEALDRSTDAILGLLEDPLRVGTWERRGLVVGHVQSGKTGNYTGLINKAADAGYKIIIVLAGLHNNLRSQTQMRLDEGFLGYETKPDSEELRIIGVGHIDTDQTIRPNYATNRTEKGDFNRTIAKNLGISPEERPWLFVVKKNKNVLDQLYKWIRDHVANSYDAESGRKIVTQLPILVIDDEADHASVDTGEQVFDSDGVPDENHQPTAINRSIRRILHAFARSAYVGYTATPFANIFIHERGETREEGPDLFPSAFIINLATPSNYVGPSRLFGLKGSESRVGLPLIRTIEDHATLPNPWMPQHHKSSHRPLYGGEDTFPPSLVTAIDAFLLACAARSVRGQANEHATMLVHVTRFNAVQHAVYEQVDEHLRRMRQRIFRAIDDAPILTRLRDLWEIDFVPTCQSISQFNSDLGSDIIPSWDHLRPVLSEVLAEVQVKMINGTAKDALDYADTAGFKVIAIGGDKLARGLTLEGLCASYFLRASRMYDTLMQMGRWFGYRPGYLDLCRLYTTDELAEWFAHITDAAEELREEFDMMAASGSTPRDYGLKVQSHSLLLVTSRLKMRTARSLMLSFSGQLLETVVFYKDRTILQQNVETLRSLITNLPEPEVNPMRIRNDSRSQWTGFLWIDVPAAEVVEFLSSFRTHPDAYRVNSGLIAQFVENMASVGELTHWTVALIGSNQGEPAMVDGKSLSVDGQPITMLERSAESQDAKRYSIRRLLSPRDESIDLDEVQWNAALTATREVWRTDPARLRTGNEPDIPNGPAIRKIRGFGAKNVAPRPDKGLLMVYVLDPARADADLLSDSPPVVAFGISFPGSNAGLKVEYKVNNRLWEQEYGSSE
jgi:hypothetical protein